MATFELIAAAMQTEHMGTSYLCGNNTAKTALITIEITNIWRKPSDQADLSVSLYVSPWIMTGTGERNVSSSIHHATVPIIYPTETAVPRG